LLGKKEYKIIKNAKSALTLSLI